MSSNRKYSIRFTLAVLAALLAAPSIANARAPTIDCPSSTVIGGLTGARYRDGSFGVRGPLNVNPDGTNASYTEGDHGFTYIANGMELLNPRRSCKPRANACREKFLRAESGGFGPGTQEFCVFAMEVEQISPRTELQSCGRGKKVIGNGKGRPRFGDGTLATFAGEQTRYYVSTTHLQQIVDGKTGYIDSAVVPSIVVPGEQANLLGRVVYVSYQGRSALAVVGDTGPNFGEGSIALHQLLLYGSIEKPPLVGPIPLSRRCEHAELSLRAPFESRPDLEGDTCRPGHKPRGDSDVRAYKAIGGGVTMVVLGRASLPMTGITSQIPVTQESLKAAAEKAEYSDVSMAAMAACLAPR